MLIKTAILIVLAAVLYSLFSGLYYLIRDQGASHRTLHALSVRIALTVLLLTLLIYGFYSGELMLRSPVPVITE
ncbi:twin transmembrane helix small protein [Aliamphritea hakodatensis]|uniref:twin transmembrane helix small protein n=1 Tax=Aliamphritea hakodatensis TaxID=2895352 RepID=UPI0022FD51AB|nr:twin transmembrane helix small protein [Aliamphritea hakodatensis]